MSEFIYLYRSADNQDYSPEVMQERMQRWMAWMKDMSARGHIKDPGQPLERTGRLVKGKDRTVTDGPYAETKDLVGGYTIIDAKDIDEAVKLSAGLPIFESGGMVEIRPVMKMG